MNSKMPYEAYRKITSGQYFVDKSAMLRELIPVVGTEERYICITRPRRFGKSVMANMIAAYFGKATDAQGLFQGLQVARDTERDSPVSYLEFMNRYDVIFVDFSEVPRDCTGYKPYIDRIQDGINADLVEAYPELHLDKAAATWDILAEIFQRTGSTFLFIMDEWDAVFHMPFVTECDKKAYLLFLKSLLKGKAYVEFAYMTGVLPIQKYSSGSEINMFMEFDMANAERFSEYFGFLDQEVDVLYERYQKTRPRTVISREALSYWYDGYHTAGGDRLYNPRSITYALINNQIRNYWTSSGPYDEIFYYVKNNVEEIRDDLAFMVAGEGIEAKMQEYAATASELNTRDQIYSAMVVYGLLTYDREEGKVCIPNRELMEQFDQLLLTNDNLGYVYNLARESARMLKATLDGDTKTMTGILKYVHDTEAPIFSYNSEMELSAVVNLAYLAARDKYRVEREDKAGEGYVDFIFYPERKGMDAILLELKMDHTPEEAIRQIKDRKYVLRLKGRLGEKPKVTGRILAVGISYDRKTKEHHCKVERLE